jgi:REP element-mobilizing transposase RayT
MTLRAPDRRPLRLPDFDYSDPGQVYFVTIRAQKGRAAGKPPFQDPGLAMKIVCALDYLRNRKGVSLLCYCLMPDHLHLILSPSKLSVSLIDVMRDFKSYTTRMAWSSGWSGRLWARSFYERAVRSESELMEICRYMLANPVKAGLVEAAEDYLYSGIADSLPV